MQVLVFNGSPQAPRGSTADVLNYFIEGIREVGAEVEVININKLDIKPCRGCFTCWTKTPGVCAIDDDMKDILSKMDAADIHVIATPVYVDGMTSMMKMVLDRSIPLSKGTVEVRDGHIRHPGREGPKERKLALVSVTGFPEIDNFDALVVHIKAICKNSRADFAGAVLRPAAWFVKAMHERGHSMDHIFNAIRKAGKELVTEGYMAEETLDTISQDVVPREIYIDIMNSQFQ